MLAQVAPSAVPSDPAEWSFYLISIALTGVLGWGVETIRKRREIARLNAEVRKLDAEVVKLNAEVQKLSAEEIKLAGDVLREVQRCRDGYADACAECGDHA